MARDFSKEDYRVVAVIGDGALSGGLALEGLNQAGHLKRKLMIVLNDNDMSISTNVGAMSGYLNGIIKGQRYNQAKDLAQGHHGSHPARRRQAPRPGQRHGAAASST